MSNLAVIILITNNYMWIWAIIIWHMQGIKVNSNKYKLEFMTKVNISGHGDLDLWHWDLQVGLGGTTDQGASIKCTKKVMWDFGENLWPLNEFGLKFIKVHASIKVKAVSGMTIVLWSRFKFCHKQTDQNQ